MNQPIVSICCITYNQEKYIKDAIEGFLMQKVDFPIEIIIHDDASTDGTAVIIRQYENQNPGFIRGIYQAENQFSKGLNHVLKNVYGAARGKYIALCEGDDYWTDPLKLQKQVDFMEAHPECSMCCHKVLYKYQDHEEKNHLFPDLEGDHIFSKEKMYRKYISATCSMMFRRLKIDELIRYLDGFLIGDVPLRMFYLQLGNMGYIDQVMATYRKHEESYWNPYYQQYNIPVHFDTLVKIKSKLKIKGSKAYDGVLSYYADNLLKEYFQEQDYKRMREVINKTGFAFLSSNPTRGRRFILYSIIAHFPGMYKFYKSMKQAN
jgi:glycosyltransferase involved in cell wall biosynthesis